MERPVTHLDDERIQRLLHGGLGAPEHSAVQAHLAGCADCRQAVSAAERENDELRSLLHRVDHQLPSISADAIIARARTGGVAWGRLAAGIFLSLGLASAAYAAPGSPLPGWIAAAGRLVTGTAPPTGPAAPALPLPAPELVGVAVAPGARLTIVFAATQSEGAANVLLTDGPDVIVRAPNGSATFTSEASRLVIDNHGSTASFEIEIPRAATWVEIRVAGVRIFLKDGIAVTSTPSPDTTAPYQLPLHPRNP